jgi:hypothetical protein
MAERVLDWVLASRYLVAKRTVIGRGFGSELVWQRMRLRSPITEKLLLAETAWAILAGGISERIIRSKFAALEAAFLDWRSAHRIVEAAPLCYRRAFAHFRHARKLRAILRVAETVAARGSLAALRDVRRDPIGFFSRRCRLGTVTAFHAAKNLGLAVAKPDRHLSRLSIIAGYDDVQEFCRTIGEYTGDPIPVVDIVLWRFAALEPATACDRFLPKEDRSAGAKRSCYDGPRHLLAQPRIPRTTCGA